jgi:hypothetical protein
MSNIGASLTGAGWSGFVTFGGEPVRADAFHVLKRGRFNRGEKVRWIVAMAKDVNDQTGRSVPAEMPFRSGGLGVLGESSWGLHG